MQSATDKSDAWIQRALQQNPCVDLGDGNYRTCPGRLSFPNIFSRSKPIPPATEGKYGANFVFPVGADINLLAKAAEACAIDKWPKGGGKLKGPFKPQEDMLKYEGYEAGGFYISATADKTPPRVFDSRQVPIIDESRVYPGVWAVAIIRPFAYDKGVNKGVSFGLQGLMIIADDKQLGGGGIEPQKAFGGVQIDAEVNPAAGFGGGGSEADIAASLFR